MTRLGSNQNAALDYLFDIGPFWETGPNRWCLDGGRKMTLRVIESLNEHGFVMPIGRVGDRRGWTLTERMRESIERERGLMDHSQDAVGYTCARCPRPVDDPVNDTLCVECRKICPWEV